MLLLQVPVAANVVAVVSALQFAAGGALQVIAAHGSALQTPFAQPNLQVVFVDGYLQAATPLLLSHVPVPYVVSVLLSAHTAGEGIMHATPEQGSGLQAPLAQPKGQVVFVDV